MTRSPARRPDRRRQKQRQRPRTPGRRPSAAARPRRRTSTGTRLLLAGVAALILASLVIALVAGGTGDGDGDEDSDSGDPPNAVAAALGVVDDPAIGTTLPTLSGEDLDGRPMTIEPSGRPQVVMFLAHWCPHCRAEVPRVQAWLGDGLPEGVDLVSVATANDENRPNYPASDWLEREGWTPRTLLDETGAAADAVGVDAFPYWLFVDGDGEILARTSGELTTEQLSRATRAMAGAGG